MEKSEHIGRLRGAIVWGREDDWRDTDRRFVFGQVGDVAERDSGGV